jgi:serine/threonine-protein kinase RsbW
MARTLSVDASGAARTRTEFASWLQRHFLSLGDERFSDLVLAVNEALANAVEFGYPEIPGQGTVAFTAVYHDDTDTLAVTVTDRGRWRQVTESSTAPAQDTLRGRGIPLIRLLTDETRIDTSESGTQVLLIWANLLTPAKSESV